MDPDAALRLIVEAALGGDSEALDEASRDLVGWLEGEVSLPPAGFYRREREDD